MGNELRDGDDVVVVKRTKIKGASSALKAGRKVKNIRLVAGEHDIDCLIEALPSPRPPTLLACLSRRGEGQASTLDPQHS